jgi:hypothetical protein
MLTNITTGHYFGLQDTFTQSSNHDTGTIAKANRLVKIPEEHYWNTNL